MTQPAEEKPTTAEHLIVDTVRRADAADGADVLAAMSTERAADVAESLDPHQAASILAEMHPVLAASVLTDMDEPEAREVLAAMRPDDRVDALSHVAFALRERLVAGLDEGRRNEVRDLSKYADDTAGGIMTTQVTALYESMSVDDAIGQLRRLSHEMEQLFYVFVIDARGHLVGVLSMRDLILADPNAPLSSIMRPGVLSVPVTMDQEQVASVMRRKNFLALPVVESDNKLVGLITIDDVIDVNVEETTEDIQKLGGSEALDAPYMDVGFFSMLKKRGGWLSVLFVGEMLTATAMSHFEEEIEKAVVLALFVPLIISSGGNSGSQAATILVRSLALGEVTLKDWWRVAGRELRTSATLGAWLGLLGFTRVVVWQWFGITSYGTHYLLVATTVFLSLIGVVTFGSIAGSMLPFLLRKCGFDPATSSAPFVATLVDVTGLIIYFSIASAVLSGTLL